MTSTGQPLELGALRAALDSTRRHILNVLDRLNDAELRQSALPSGWSPVELVRHLTLGGERYWISSIVGGETLDWIPDGERADWHVDATTPTSDVIEGYRQQIDTSSAVLDGATPHDPPRRRDPMWDEWGVDFPNVGVILLHLIVETATHAGHLDATAELLDERQHLVIA